MNAHCSNLTFQDGEPAASLGGEGAASAVRRMLSCTVYITSVVVSARQSQHCSRAVAVSICHVLSTYSRPEHNMPRIMPVY